ncbi:hypothetical protein J437_LFUL016705 [Ladona fulva]|uniref:Uncharacterized protein n=1 Tax=Ladona fulva TaxID=123851 RepID=A0A8K0P9I9_LADFU|nr:hypothetical protein J437_LFUL016705 [Ladona fulva]
MLSKSAYIAYGTRNERTASGSGKFGHLARQVYPEKPSELLRVYKEATSKAFGYLLLDNAQETSDCVRFQTNIFPDEITVVYALAHMIENETVEVQ